MKYRRPCALQPCARTKKELAMERHPNSAFWAGSKSLAAAGLWPHQHELPKGIHLYRFIDLSKTPSSLGADGPWWFEYEHFQTMRTFAERNGYSLGYVARLFAAILYEWSEVNAVVRARVTCGPLLVWKGKGKQVEATGKDPRDIAALHGVVTAAQPVVARKMTPTQGPLEVLQLYIPGLGKPHHRFSSFMKFEGCEQIRTG
jgi:hypothetical protein